MSVFRRRQPPAPAPPVPRLPTEVEGVAGGSAGFPYEFHTTDGIPVRLHDMTFEGVEYRVSPPGLMLRFRYDDPTWTPPEAAATPVALFAFTGVQVWQWEDDHDLFDVPDEYRGQVSSFDCYAPTNVFALETINTSLLFSADRLTVRLEPSAD